MPQRSDRKPGHLLGIMSCSLKRPRPCSTPQLTSAAGAALRTHEMEKVSLICPWLELHIAAGGGYLILSIWLWPFTLTMQLLIIQGSLGPLFLSLCLSGQSF